MQHAKQDYTATLEGAASDTSSKANQATARVRLSLLQEQPRAGSAYRANCRPPRPVPRRRRRLPLFRSASAWRW